MALRSLLSPGGRPVRYRDRGLDALRGLAVALMVLDHIAAVAGWGGLWRYSLTRAALPLFMFCSGQLVARFGPPSPKRSLQVLAVGVLELGCFAWLGLPLPGPVLLIALLLPAFPYAVRYPYAIGALGIVQVVTWPLPWSGYQPGELLALVALASIAPRIGPMPENAPAVVGWLADLGRRPLIAYLLHLVLLLGVAWALGA